MRSVTVSWGWVVLNLMLVRAHYTNEWAVEVEGGEEVARDIALKHGFQFKGEILPGYYLFAHNRISKRSIEQSHEHHRVLREEPQVRWLEQQKVISRVKRDYLAYSRRPSRPFKGLSYLDDPRWPQMWYLNRGNDLDMNVEGAWKEGVTGKGVVVTILDDGLEKNHPDIARNYDPQASYDVNEQDEDPQPRYDLVNSNKHGTRCAGEVAAEANNSICAVGVAWNAGVGGVRMLDGDVTDAVEARSLSLNSQHIDIYSASWGPDDDGKTVDGPGRLATAAFEEGIRKGRRGHGSIFVWASGNGGRDYDNCNCDGYTNSIWTLSISSATEHGDVPWYSEACSSTLATTYSSGSTGEKQIVTTDLHHGCTTSHTGTSASAPLAAGICALALEANPSLTWRDMQHIVVRTARPHNLNAPDWAVNGVGRNVSHSFGYGLMDATEMVRLARKWKNVPTQRMCEVQSTHTNKLIPAKSRVPLPLYVTGDRCNHTRFLEHVQARVSLSALRRGDIEIILVSPAGTRSTLLARRTYDSSGGGFEAWPFMTVHTWGESPVGKWQLVIHNEGRYLGRAMLREWSLVFFGTNENPDPDQRTPPLTTTTTTSTPMPTTSSTSTTTTTSNPKALLPMLPPHSNNLQPLGQPDSHRKPVTLNDWSMSIFGTDSDPNQDIGEGDTRKEEDNGHPVTSGCGLGSTGCIDCQEGLLLQEGSCVRQCAERYYESKEDAKCFPCHYSCKDCNGPNDYECTQCFPDALIKETSMNRHFCHSKELVTKFDELYAAHKYTVAAFVLLFLTIIGGVVVYAWFYMTRKRKGKYALLNGETEQATLPVMAMPYNDVVSSDGE